MKTIKGVLAVVTILTLSVLVTDKTSAISSEEIYTKVLVNNVENCYKYALKSKIGFSDYISFDSLMNDGYKQGASDARMIYIPAINDSYNRIENTGSNGGRVASCYEVFMGNSSGTGTDGFMEGLFKLNGKTSIPGPINKSDLTNFMSDTMKYSVETEQDASGEEYCYSVYVKESTTAAQKVLLGSACANKDNYPLSSVNGINFTGGQDNTGYTLVGGVKYVSNAAGTGWHDEFSVTVTKDGCTYQGNGYSGVQKCSVTKDFGLNEPDVGDIELPTSLWPNRPEITIEITKQTSGTGGSEKVSFIKDNNKWQDFVTGLTGKNYDDFVVSEADKYDFYLQYLKNNFGQDGTSIASSTCQADKPAVLTNAATDEYYIYIKNSGWCLANLDSYKVKQSHAMTVFSTGNNRTLGMVINTAEDLVKLMGELDYSDTSMFTDIDAAGTADQTADNGTTEEETDKCFDNAGALGWVLCPITSGIAKLGSSAYNWIEENFLQVKASIFTESNNGVQDAWGTIRNIANVGFIIMLLVVVFSQITGVGIDNYGIKRILPRIIIGAIIMNLSYIICELMIDVSNIFGSGLNDLLSNLGPGFSGSAGVNDPSIAQYLIVGGAGVLATAGYLILTSGGLGAVLMLFIAALTVVISILVLFVILIVRQAGIVICVVVAPIAVLCYLLPNTEKVFKKWWELMKGLLLVYPLCGLLIGAGGFIGKVFGNLAVSGSGDMQMGFALSAMVVQAIPYLFIPMLLRSSLAAMGNLGARISGFGNRIGSGISRRIGSSDMMKNSQELAAERRTRFRAGIGSDGKPRKDISAVGRFMRGGRRGMARAASQYLKDEAIRRRGEGLLNGVGLDAAIIGQQKQAEKNEMMDYMVLINNETRNGEDEKKLNDKYDEYMNDDNKSGAVAATRIAGRRKDTAASFMNKNITGRSVENGVETLSDVAANRDPKTISSVMKEIATGENSGMFRSSNPLAFEFAAQYNRNYKEQYKPGDVRPEARYSAWRNQANVSQALNNYVAEGKDLMGIKNSALTEINDLMDNGVVSDTENARLRKLASETIDNRGKTGVWDTTKAENIYRMAGRLDEFRNVSSNNGVSGAVQTPSDSGTIQIVSEGGFAGEINNLRNERGGLATNQPKDNNGNDGSIIIPGRR